MKWTAALAIALPLAAQAAMGPDDARHLLNRTGFGAQPREIAEYAALSRSDAVERQLAGMTRAARTPPPDWVREAIVPPRELRQASPEERKVFQATEIRRGVDLRTWWLEEMLQTRSPLTERMTLFWHNHFVSSQQKVRYTKLMYEQNVLLRRHAGGRFSDLLHAVSKDPAMVIYLDSASNRKGKPNENFAREVMELFTLGEGHYTEADVREAARAFTGWSIDPDSGDFKWRPALHDDGTKTILGRSGNFDGDEVLDILLARPATAEFVVTKLWREFVSPEPDPAEVRRIAQKFQLSNYEIKVALRELLLVAGVLGAGESRRADQVAGRPRRRDDACARFPRRRPAAARARRRAARTEPVLAAERQGLAGRRGVDQLVDPARAEGIHRADLPRGRDAERGDGRDAAARERRRLRADQGVRPHGRGRARALHPRALRNPVRSAALARPVPRRGVPRRHGAGAPRARPGHAGPDGAARRAR